MTLHYITLHYITLHYMHACMHACMHTYIHNRPCSCPRNHPCVASVLAGTGGAPSTGPAPEPPAPCLRTPRFGPGAGQSATCTWAGGRRTAAVGLRTDGVDTHGAAAKVMNFDRLGKRYALALLGPH